MRRSEGLIKRSLHLGYLSARRPSTALRSCGPPGHLCAGGDKAARPRLTFAAARAPSFDLAVRLTNCRRGDSYGNPCPHLDGGEKIEGRSGARDAAPQLLYSSLPDRLRRFRSSGDTAASDLSRSGGRILARSPSSPSPLPIKRLRINRKMSMVDDPPRWWATEEHATCCYGHVVVAGLGLGLIVHALAACPDVERTTVVEADPNVTTLVQLYLPRSAKIEVVAGDFWTRDGQPDGVFYHLFVGDGQHSCRPCRQDQRRASPGPSRLE